MKANTTKKSRVVLMGITVGAVAALFAAGCASNSSQAQQSPASAAS